jgi:hypothetical protein
VDASRSDPPTPRARAVARAAQRREQERAAAGRRRGSDSGSAGSSETRSTDCASSRDYLPRPLQRIRRQRRRRKKRATGGSPPERWNPLPPSPRAAEAAEE